MDADRTTRIAGILVAVFVTVAIHGAMLWQFDVVAQQGTVATAVHAASPPA